jgi:hypothetical protein
MTERHWDVRPASKGVGRDWRRLRKAHSQSTLKALSYWANDPYAPNELVISPRGRLSLRQWGSGNNKKSYEQRGFIVAGTTVYFIVVDDIPAVIITALIPYLTDRDYE